MANIIRPKSELAGLDEFATDIAQTISYKANGLGPEVDWLGLTYNTRKIRTKAEGEYYLDIAEPWQFFYDWLFYNFPRMYIQLARGHDKTERGAWWSLLWGLSRDDGQALCCGTDKENAKLYLHALKWQVKRHPDLFQGKVKVNNYDVHFTNGTHIRVIPVNEGGSFGHTPDLLMINDFHAWTNHEYWTNLWTACGKRINNRIWIESNALALGKAQTNWIRPFREMVSEFAGDMKNLQMAALQFGDGDESYVRGRATCGPEWMYAAPAGMHASWQWKQIPQWKRSMLPNAYDRMINNKDTGDGDQFLTFEQYDTMVYQAADLFKPHKDSKKLVCVDMATTQDAAVVSLVTGFRDDAEMTQVEVNQMEIWTGSRDNPIFINGVIKRANEMADQYSAEKWCDPWEMRSHVQADTSWNVFEFHKGENQRAIPLEIYKAATERRLKVPDDCAPAMQAKQGRKPKRWNLRTECTEAVLVEKAYGTRLDHKSGGFTDRLMSMGMGVVILTDPECKLPKKNRWSTGTIVHPWQKKTWGEILDNATEPVSSGITY